MFDIINLNVNLKCKIIIAWRSDVTLWGSWITPDTGRSRHVFPEIQLWPWLAASTQASKRDIRSSAQRIQWNPSNGTPGACLYSCCAYPTSDTDQSMLFSCWMTQTTKLQYIMWAKAKKKKWSWNMGKSDGISLYFENLHMYIQNVKHSE